MKKIKYLEFLPIIFITMLMYLLILHVGRVFELLRILAPIVQALVIAYLLNPLAKRLNRNNKLSWTFAVVIAYIILIGIFVILGMVIVPVILENIRDFINNIPSLMQQLERLVTDVEGYLEEKTNYNTMIESINFDSIIERVSNLSTDAVSFFYSSITGFVSVMMKFIIGLIISIYLLLRKENFISIFHRMCTAFLKAEHKDNLYRVLGKANHFFSKFLIGKAIDSLIVGVIAYIGFMFLKMPYAVILALSIGITNIIPYFGPFFGAVPGIVIVGLIDPVKLIGFIIFVIVLQQFDGYVLGPKILGDSIGVSPVWIIIGVTVGGGFFGPVGMILGVPMVALVNSEISYYLDRREDQKKKAQDSELVVEKRDA